MVERLAGEGATLDRQDTNNLVENWANGLSVKVVLGKHVEDHLKCQSNAHYWGHQVAASFKCTDVGIF